ncbi:response regulator [Clostridium sp. 'White wine YQ']|uniref:response regulator n=1 Tax=Clostridium sp. 'White wine YQ' TaxID=3027474 RepID=UPI002366CF76|nr:response regulator [Clostridium sp. 'White wine YQ']MDD7795805.1 response regulator [Clostridium sp. 'White wine YQ']
MYKLFLADDEIDLIDGIKSLISWEDYDIEVVGEADNGLDALDSIISLKPDIIIMDIKMPKMTGLEVLEELTKIKIKSKCIILSGYDDFSFAKKAIELSASNYLLKPCKPSEILDVVLNVKKTLDFERSKEALLNENILTLKEKLFTELILGNHNYSSESLLSKLNLYNIQNDFNYILVPVISLDYSSMIYDIYNEIDINSIKISIKNLIYSSLSSLFTIESLDYKEYIVLILFISDNCYSYEKIKQSLLSLKDSIKANLGFTISIGIGDPVTDLKEIDKCYKESYLAINSKFYLGDDILISIHDVKDSESKQSFYPVEEELAIINALRTGDNLIIDKYIESFYYSLSKGGFPLKNYLQGSTLSLLGSIYKFCIENDINIDFASTKDFSPFHRILKCQTINEIKDQVKLIIDKIFNEFNKNHKNNSLVSAAMNYIINNYNKDISLETTAKVIYITPTYLSQLFKLETGVNFLEFLHSYRIEKSKELLKNRTLKNYQVAKLVGYSNEKHFSKTFKKYTGLTPKQFRESISNFI